MSERVVIIGAGEIGRALEKILAARNLSIALWDREPSKVPGQKSLSEIIPTADFIFLCIPSWAVREMVTGIAPRLKKGAIVISLAKGIEEKTSKTMDEVLIETLPKGQHFGILSGPMLAEEIMRGRRGIAVFGVTDTKLCKRLTGLFTDSQLVIECSCDLRGVALGGVLKNIYSIALGIADGLGFGGNEKGWLAAKVLKELTEITKIFGGKTETATGPAGLGDLIATGYSPYSRNRKIGEELIKTGECCIKGEGFVSLPAVLERLGKKKNQFPLLIALGKIAVSKKNAKEIFQKIFKEIK